MTSSKSNIFTIAVCTYNQCAMLKQTLDSLNKLEIDPADNVSIIVVDNNSSDETKVICDDFFKRSIQPFRYFFEKKQGLSHARNRAINETDEGIIIFTDDDVIVPVDWVSNIIQEYSSSDVSSVYGKVIPEWRNNKPSWFNKKLNPSYALLDYGDKRFIATSEYQEFYGANFSCEVSLLKQFGGFDTELGRKGDKLFIGEETEVFIKLLKLNKTLVYNPNIFVWHVIREDRKNKKFLIKYFRDIAESNVYISLKNARRKLFGIPYYKHKEYALFYLTFIPKYLYFSIMNRVDDKFFLSLCLIKTNRSLQLYIQNYLSK